MLVLDHNVLFPKTILSDLFFILGVKAAAGAPLNPYRGEIGFFVPVAPVAPVAPVVAVSL
jgi:hypothetical protein